MNERGDTYTHGHADSVLRSHRWRTAENSAAYLLPRLTPGSRLLDVGCGPGTLTVDLARRVAPGAVVGIDAAAGVLAEAAAFSREAGVTNVEFRPGDIYALVDADGTYDVVHAHQVLQHLSDPVGALREMRRVCRPGGVVAARDSDYAAMTWYPEVPELQRWLDLYHQLARGNRAEPDAGRYLRAWAHAAGFTEVTSGASVWCFSSDEERAWWGGLWADRVTGSAFSTQATERGLSDERELEQLAAGWRRWAASRDGWFAVLHGEILACS